MLARSGASGGGASQQHLQQLSREAELQLQQQQRRKVRFLHVRLNRAHCRATYEGYPL